ncbi:hypothetical protein MLD38_026134 [Melastoma candidum]|uniref:Uncharacterized protein n=1 Tax=Melastoma candidum TaxID=119954 RepID=A0ACB9P4B2_9MYRT|nr:hypothetical protein MLD38_026134 [Melastoma candidum]
MPKRVQPDASRRPRPTPSVQDQDPGDERKLQRRIDGARGLGLGHPRWRVQGRRVGIILLELLTEKMVQNDGLDLAKWVHSVVKEEWTGEVFDTALSEEGSEERMVKLLQVAVGCIGEVTAERQSMSRVAEPRSSTP